MKHKDYRYVEEEDRRRTGAFTVRGQISPGEMRDLCSIVFAFNLQRKRSGQPKLIYRFHGNNEWEKKWTSRK